MLYDSCADSDAASASRLGRPIPDVDAAVEGTLHELLGSFARADQHEIRAAPHVIESKPPARCIQQRLRLLDLSQILTEVVEILQGCLYCRSGRDVHAVNGDRAASGINGVRCSDETTDPQTRQSECL